MTNFTTEISNMAKMMDPHFASMDQADVMLKWGPILNDSPISHIVLGDDQLSLQFQNGRNLTITDNGQSCCETRYMTSDDDLQSLIGARLVHIEVAAAENADAGDDVHEQMFLKIRTSNGDMTVVTHNEHNGYYGGFAINASWSD